MRTRIKPRLSLSIVLLLALPTLAVATSSMPVQTRSAAARVQPANTRLPGSFDLRSAGYEPFSAASMMANQSFLSSLDFIDSDHLLVTFKQFGLVKRLRTCPPSHSDRLVRALVYELSTGKVIKRADWYLHDRRRYVWPLGSGQFLLRKGNQLYRLNGQLEETMLFESPRELSWVDVTPDGKQIILETKDDTVAASKDQKSQEGSFKIRFLDTATLAPQRELQSRTFVPLQGTSTGYPDLVHGVGDLWLVRFGPDNKARNYVARVKSPCTPNLLFPAANTMFIGRCSSLSSYSVSMFTVTGTRLWRQRWEDLRDVPSLSRSEDGSRFAISTVHQLPADTNDKRAEAGADPQANVEQLVEIFETATGTPISAVKLTPAFIAGQNYALSPEGSQLAVLRGSRIELHRLSPPSPEERAKYLAVKADVPGVYAPSEEDDEFVADELALAQAETVEAVSASGPSESPAAAPTQPASDAAGPLMTIRKSTAAVLVDVVVLDSKNQPVQGLTRHDFAVKEDGVAQRVRYFEDHKREEDKAAPSAPVQRPANVFSNAGVNPGTDAVTVILFDTLNTPPMYQAYALQQLTEYLKAKPRDVRAALFALTSGLHMITGFTDDETALLAASQGKRLRVSSPLLGKRSESSIGYDRVVESLREQFMNRNLSNRSAGESTPSQRPQVNPGNSQRNEFLSEHELHQRFSEQVAMDVRVQKTLDALTQLSRYLSGIPGRKNLIWLSSSFPFWISGSPDSDHPFRLTYDYGDQIKKAINLFAAAHVAVYPVNVRGLAGRASSNLSSAGALRSEDFQESDAVLSDTASMNEIATGTGGKAFPHTNGIKQAIQQSVEQSSSFYTLSYSPTNAKFDGKLRHIRVEAAQRGYKLQYRTAYYAVPPEKSDKDAQELARELQLAALQPGAPNLRQIPVIARVVPVGSPFMADTARFMLAAAPKKGSAKKEAPKTTMVQRYAVDYAIPASRLRFDPMPDGKLHGVCNFLAAAFDTTGALMARTGTALKSDLPAESYKDLLAAGFRMHQELDVPTSATSLRMAVQDATTGSLATLEVALPVPPPSDLPRRKGRKALPEVEPD